MSAAGSAKVNARVETPSEAALKRRLAETERRLAEARVDFEAFVTAISHDLQAPLRHVRAFSDLLARPGGAGLDKDAAGYLEFVRSGAAKAQDMVAALVAYARLTTHAKPFSRVDAGACLARAIESLRDTIARCGARIETNSLPCVAGDAEQLTQVFAHLLSNALRFGRDAEAPRVTVRVERCGAEWKISVSDHGVGMAPGFMERVFLPFQKADPGSAGLGMGLAVCRRIVERHGGRIGAESKPGQGSKFFFTLPAFGDDAGQRD